MDTRKSLIFVFLREYNLLKLVPPLKSPDETHYDYYNEYN
jgi:hypothetical protein